MTTEQLLAAFWLDGDLQPDNNATKLQQLTSFVEKRQFRTADDAVENAAKHLQVRFVKEDVRTWVCWLSFMGHPHAIWNFMLNAVCLAKTDDQLWRIASDLAEILLAHYGSLMPFFENQARKDPKFARMLTGAWRHRMCDDVWVRLRVLQAEVETPLPQVISLENGLEYMARHVSQSDRDTLDKGRYSPDAKGNWIKRSVG